jgi:hypothetical protein
MARQALRKTCQRALRRLRELSVVDDDRGGGRQIRQVAGE